jgi:phosphoribosylanthranilate isomerase
MRTRIKICGITRPEDAAAAATCGADAIGLVFDPKSPRCLTAGQAAAILAVVPPFVTTVALFRDPPQDLVGRILREIAIDLLQFHGQEDPTFCARFAKPYIKALPMGSVTLAELPAVAADYAAARGVLLDGNRRGERGGQGQCFAWEGLPAVEKPVVVAGGLAPHNVTDAITIMAPWGVDVSSGVESSPGIKDHALMHSFVDQVRRADALSRT